MSSSAAKVVAAVAILLTLVLAFVGYRVSRQYAESSEKARAQVEAAARKEQESPKILAVVAVKPLAAYRKIAKDDVVLAEVTIAPRDYYTSLEDVVNQEPLVDIDQGAPVTKRYFAEGNVLAKSVPPGFQAVSVEVSDVIGVGGFVRPGDIVDVLLYLKGGNNDISTTQARILLKNTRLLAYQDLLVDRPEGLKEEEGKERGGRRQRTAVLAVKEADTTRLMLGASLGELRLALHGVSTRPGDEATALTAAATDAAATTPSGGATASLTATAVPMTDEALKAEAAKKVPDLAYTAAQLSRIELPPSEKAKKKQVVQEKIFIYRSSEMQTVTP